MELIGNISKRLEAAKKYLHNNYDLQPVDLIEMMKGEAKDNLLSLMKEICKNCHNLKRDVSDGCSDCAFKKKERLIRAFLE